MALQCRHILTEAVLLQNDPEEEKRMLEEARKAEEVAARQARLEAKAAKARRYFIFLPACLLASPLGMLCLHMCICLCQGRRSCSQKCLLGGLSRQLLLQLLQCVPVSSSFSLAHVSSNLWAMLCNNDALTGHAIVNAY